MPEQLREMRLAKNNQASMKGSSPTTSVVVTPTPRRGEPRQANSTVTYDAFMSYSHAADGELAPALQSALARFSKAWHQRRALRIFRDKTSLSATPSLWPTIEKAMLTSRWFLLLASPDAAQSRWVQQEVEWWLAHRSLQNLLIVLTDGHLSWNPDSHDFDWTMTDALPNSLKGVFESEPLWVDVRSAKREMQLSPKDPRFQDAVADLAAPLHGRPKEDLIGEDVHEHRRTLPLVRAAITALVVLTLSSIIAGGMAWIQRIEAENQRQIAISRELAASANSQLGLDPELSLLLAIEAAKVRPTHEAEESLRQALTQSRISFVMRGHTGPITSLSYSPDGESVLSSSTDGTARVWNARTGQQLAFLSGHAGGVWSAAFSPDGKRILTGGRDHLARLWDATTGDLLGTLRVHRNTVTSVSFSPNGLYTATASGDRTVALSPLKQMAKPILLCGHTDIVRQVDFAPDCQRVITASYDGTARIWDVETGKQLAMLSGHNSSLSMALFSPDGEKALTASTDQTARIWDPVTGSETALLRGHTGSVRAAAFSPDSQRVVTASSDHTARVWDVVSGRETAILSGHTACVNSVAFSPDGQKIVTASDDFTARVWSATSADQLMILRGHQDSVVLAAFSPDGANVVTGSSFGFFASIDGVPLAPEADNTVRLWDVNPTGAVTTLRIDSGYTYSAAFSPDGTVLAAVGSDQTVRLWDTGTWKVIADLNIHKSRVMRALFSPDSELLLTLAYSEQGRLWAVRSGQLLRTLDMPLGTRAGAAAFSPDSGLLVVDNGTEALVFEVKSKRDLVILQHRNLVMSVNFSPDGARIVTTCRDGTTRIWEAASGREVASLADLSGVGSAVFSPNGSAILIYDASASARVWDGCSGGDVIKLQGHTNGLTSATYSPDGAWIATASWDNSARLWEVTANMATIKLRGHLERINTVAFSQDSKWLVTASQDATARVWETATGRQVAILRGHTDVVETAAFSPNGRQIVTAGQDGAVLIQECTVCRPLEELLSVAQHRVTRELTSDELQTFLHND